MLSSLAHLNRAELIFLLLKLGAQCVFQGLLSFERGSPQPHDGESSLIEQSCAPPLPAAPSRG